MLRNIVFFLLFLNVAYSGYIMLVKSHMIAPIAAITPDDLRQKDFPIVLDVAKRSDSASLQN